MAFTDFRFPFFFLAVALVYWSSRHHFFRKLWLLLCSYAFYAAWDWRFLSLIWISTAVDYVAGRRLEHAQSPTRRRGFLALSLVVNLGLLGFFKYFDFFIQSARDLFGLLGLPFATQSLSIILPVGISFYTFQTLSYTIDVYRCRIRPTRSLLDFALFVAFFPQLLAGPIIRARNFLPQLERARRWDWLRIQLGVQYLLMGFVKKVAVADRLAVFADPIFADPSQYHAGALWAATLAFTIQVYADFSGYSDMAIGLAHLLGFKLAKNFDLPFLAPSLRELWRRWHITLSTWMRDYVYVPLGGNRGGPLRTDFNLLVTMALFGLWHGANWNFVVFGVLHGVILVLHRRFRRATVSFPRLGRFLESRAGNALCVAATFATFGLSTVIFRNPTLAQGMTMLERMFVMSSGRGNPMNDRVLWYTVILVAVCQTVAAWNLHKRIDRLPAPVQGFAYAAGFTLALMLHPELGMNFVYFQF